MIKKIFLFFLYIFLSINVPLIYAAQINCDKIVPFKDLIDCKGERHHLIEKRLAERLGIDPNLIPSICLSKEDHNVFTKRWRDKIKYRTNYNDIPIIKIILTIHSVYKDNPCVIKTLDRYLLDNLKGRYAELIRKFLKGNSKALQVLSKAFVVVSGLAMGYEAYQFFAILDDSFEGDEFVGRNIETSLVAISIADTGDESGALKKLGEAYYFIGYAVYHKMVPYKSEFEKEILDKGFRCSDKMVSLAIDLFGKSIQLDPDKAEAFYFLGSSLLAINDYENARIYLTRAVNLFNKQNNSEWVNITKETMKSIDEKIGKTHE